MYRNSSKKIMGEALVSGFGKKHMKVMPVEFFIVVLMEILNDYCFTLY